MKQTILTLLVALCALAGTATTARAESKTVTYHITSTYNGNSYTLTFVPSSNGFGYETGTKTVTILNVNTTTGFHVQLDDGLYLQLSLSQAGLTFGEQKRPHRHLAQLQQQPERLPRP